MQKAGTPLANLVLRSCLQFEEQPLEQVGCKNNKNFASNHPLALDKAHNKKVPVKGLFAVHLKDLVMGCLRFGEGPSRRKGGFFGTGA